MLSSGFPSHRVRHEDGEQLHTGALHGRQGRQASDQMSCEETLWCWCGQGRALTWPDGEKAALELALTLALGAANEIAGLSKQGRAGEFLIE